MKRCGGTQARLKCVSVVRPPANEFQVDIKHLSSSPLLFYSYPLLSTHLTAALFILSSPHSLYLSRCLSTISLLPLPVSPLHSHASFASPFPLISIRQPPLVLLLSPSTDSALSSFHLLSVPLIFALLFPLSSAIPSLVSFHYYFPFPPVLFLSLHPSAPHFPFILHVSLSSALSFVPSHLHSWAD